MKGTVYDKLRGLKDRLKMDFSEISAEDLFRICSKLATWHYPKKRTKAMMLSKNETMLYEFLLNNRFNPSTVYKWMLASSTTEDIQKKLMCGKISQKSAMSRAKPFKTLNQTEAKLLYQIKLCIQKYVIR